MFDYPFIKILNIEWYFSGTGVKLIEARQHDFIPFQSYWIRILLSFLYLYQVTYIPYIYIYISLLSHYSWQDELIPPAWPPRISRPPCHKIRYFRLVFTTVLLVSSPFLHFPNLREEGNGHVWRVLLYNYIIRSSGNIDCFEAKKKLKLQRLQLSGGCKEILPDIVLLFTAIYRNFARANEEVAMEAGIKWGKRISLIRNRACYATHTSTFNVELCDK